MPELADSKRAHREALAELRERYKGEIEQTIKALIGVRDNPKSKPREITDASRVLSAILGVPRATESRSTEAQGKRFRPEEWDLDPAERDRVERVLAED